MSDLIERLREPIWETTVPGDMRLVPETTRKDMFEAIAEIEALRTRAESAEALLAEAAIRLGSLVDGECTYVASEIRISATSHGDAIGRVSRARSTLSKIGDRT